MVFSFSDENKCAIHTSWSSNENWHYDWTEICNSLVDLCPPTNLVVNDGQSENILTWSAPGNCEDFLVSSLPYFQLGIMLLQVMTGMWQQESIRVMMLPTN